MSRSPVSSKCGVRRGLKTLTVAIMVSAALSSYTCSFAGAQTQLILRDDRNKPEVPTIGLSKVFAAIQLNEVSAGSHSGVTFEATGSHAFHATIKLTFNGSNVCYLSKVVAETILGQALSHPIHPWNQGNACTYTTSNFSMNFTFLSGNQCSPSHNYYLKMLPDASCITSAKGVIWIDGFDGTGTGVSVIVQPLGRKPTAARIAIIKRDLLIVATDIAEQH